MDWHFMLLGIFSFVYSFIQPLWVAGTEACPVDEVAYTLNNHRAITN